MIHKIVEIGIQISFWEIYKSLSVKDYLPPGLERKQTLHLIDYCLFKRELTSKTVYSQTLTLYFIQRILEKQDEDLMNKNLKMIWETAETDFIYQSRVTKKISALYGIVGSANGFWIDF